MPCYGVGLGRRKPTFDGASGRDQDPEVKPLGNWNANETLDLEVKTPRNVSTQDEGASASDSESIIERELSHMTGVATSSTS